MKTKLVMVAIGVAAGLFGFWTGSNRSRGTIRDTASRRASSELFVRCEYGFETACENGPAHETLQGRCQISDIRRNHLGPPDI